LVIDPETDEQPEQPQDVPDFPPVTAPTAPARLPRKGWKSIVGALTASLSIHGLLIALAVFLVAREAVRMTANVAAGDGGAGLKVGALETVEPTETPISIELLKPPPPTPPDPNAPKPRPTPMVDAPATINPIDPSEVVPPTPSTQVFAAEADELDLGSAAPLVPAAPNRPAAAPPAEAPAEGSSPPTLSSVQRSDALASAEAPAVPDAPTGAAGTGGARGVEGGAPVPDPANVAPEYPAAAKKRGLTGDVVLLVTIEPDGKVSDAVVEASSGHDLLDRAAVTAVRRWRFVRADHGGPRVCALQAVRFSLNG
jgi:protein TonB